MGFFYEANIMLEVNQINTKPTDAQESLWFATFLKYTNQKKVTAEAVKKVLVEYQAVTDTPSNIRFLDIGCGEGELSKHVINTFTDKKISHLTGIDKDQDFLNQTKQGLDTEINTNLIKADCFDFNYALLTKHDLILASNVLYYCKDIPAFIMSSFNVLENNGVYILIHESGSSTPKTLRKKYEANISGDIPATIKQYTDENKITIKEDEVCSYISFNSDLFRLLNGISTASELKTKIHADDYLLLEFIVQTSMEVLEHQKSLINYLTDIQTISIQHNNRIPITSSIQILSRSKS
jgi:ubiquinone/menaquinone biosynthesis C-methylase UbiE